MWKPAIASLLLLAGPGTAASASYLIQPDGSGDFATIQDALFAAAAGDTIILADGTFTGAGNRNLNYVGKSLVVKSQSGTPVTCVLDCQGAARGFTFVSVPASARLLGVTVTNGVGDGAAIYCENSFPTIENCVLDGNGGSQDRGGGVHCRSNAHPILSRCEITGNSSSSGGGVYAYGAGADLFDCVIEGNTSNAVGGGGVWCSVNADVLLSGCTIRDNHAIGPSGQGGGVWCGGSVVTPSTLEVTGCDVSGNDAAYLAGGMFMNASFITVTQTLIAGNRCTTLDGGGIYVASSNPVFTNVTIAGNRGGGAGGAAHLYSTHATFDRCVLWGNCADGSWDAVAMSGSGSTASFLCSDAAPADVGGTGALSFDANCMDTNPLFCGPEDCTIAPTPWGNYTIDTFSPLTATASPCGMRIGALDIGCVTELAAPVTAGGTFVSRAAPNPTTGGTRITFAAPVAGAVEVRVLDAAGRQVRAWTERAAAGEGGVSWDGRDERGRMTPAGVYFWRLRAGDAVSTGRVVRLVR
jgi:Right handed beta helix region/FlgD Ig-like domain